METIWHSWPAFLLRYYCGITWRALPGPWPVKLVLIIVCTAIPGPQDELLLIALTAACRAWRSKRGNKS